jgi:hypothetical protein
MAYETVQLNSGSGGATIVVDSIGSDSIQMVKLGWGPDGTLAFGATPYSYLSVGTNEDKTNVKNTAGVLYSLEASNTNTSPRYVKLYNKSSAPDVASDASLIVFRFAIPGSGGIALSWPAGKLFSSGISFVLVTGATNTDAVEVAANEIMLNLSYV